MPVANAKTRARTITNTTAEKEPENNRHFGRILWRLLTTTAQFFEEVRPYEVPLHRHHPVVHRIAIAIEVLNGKLLGGLPMDLDHVGIFVAAVRSQRMKM